MPKTKIFHVITHLELGGAQKITLMTLERLPRERYELGLVASPDGLLVEWANRIPGLTRLWVPALVRDVRPISDFHALLQMWQIFRRERPALVHTHGPKAGILGRWAAKLAGVRLILHTSHGFGFNDFQPSIVRAFYVWLERLTGRITTKHVFVSRHNAEKAEQLGVVRPGDWILSRSGIDIDDYMQPGPARTKLDGWDIPEEKNIVGMIACFKPQKAPLEFVDLAARVLRETDSVHFVMVGDGELRSAIEQRIRDHGIERHVTLLGWRSVEEMPAIYRNIDIVVLTSLWEGLPRVFPEAMASGLPIVATDVDGAREAVIDGKTGFLFKPYDIEGMAGAVLTLLRDPQLRRSMGAEARRHVAEFDVGTAISGMDEEYQRLLEGSR